MSDNFDDGESAGGETASGSVSEFTEHALFGDFAVIAPGVQIILEGRPVSYSGS
ncbi:MAG: hypothetical protein AAFP68_03290 [Pseudomonadota bacterium]